MPCCDRISLIAEGDNVIFMESGNQLNRSNESEMEARPM